MNVTALIKSLSEKERLEAISVLLGDNVKQSYNVENTEEELQKQSDDFTLRIMTNKKARVNT